MFLLKTTNHYKKSLVIFFGILCPSRHDIANTLLPTDKRVRKLAKLAQECAHMFWSKIGVSKAAKTPIFRVFSRVGGGFRNISARSKMACFDNMLVGGGGVFSYPFALPFLTLLPSLTLLRLHLCTRIMFVRCVYAAVGGWVRWTLLKLSCCMTIIESSAWIKREPLEPLEVSNIAFASSTKRISGQRAWAFHHTPQLNTCKITTSYPLVAKIIPN